MVLLPNFRRSGGCGGVIWRCGLLVLLVLDVLGDRIKCMIPQCKNTSFLFRTFTRYPVLWMRHVNLKMYYCNHVNIQLKRLISLLKDCFRRNLHYTGCDQKVSRLNLWISFDWLIYFNSMSICLFFVEVITSVWTRYYQRDLSHLS